MACTRSRKNRLSPFLQNALICGAGLFERSQDRALPMRIRHLAAVALSAAALPLSVFAQEPPQAPAARSLEDLVSAVVHMKTFIHPDGRTVGNLGREREGSAIIIDD